MLVVHSSGQESQLFCSTLSCDFNICLDVKVCLFLYKTAETPPFILTDSIDLLVAGATGTSVGAQSVDTGGS